MRRAGAAFVLLPAIAFGAPPGSVVQLEPYHARYDLSGGRSDWTDTGALLDVRLPSRFAWGGYGRETERFDLRDSEAGGSLYAPLGESWAASLDATMSSTHRVLPRHSLMGQLEKRLGQGWNVRGGLRRSEYASGRADLRLITLERYFARERVAYTFYSGQAERGGSAPAHRLDWSHYFNERGSVGVSVARGREVENIPPEGVLITDVRSLGVSASYWLSARWGVSLVGETLEQGTLYRRHGIRAGLRHRF
jgi:YaiO family outer membrane protein